MKQENSAQPCWIISLVLPLVYWSADIHSLFLLSPNPDIEIIIRAQVLNAPKKLTKSWISRYLTGEWDILVKFSFPQWITSFSVKQKLSLWLVIKLFDDFLGAFSDCALIVIFYICIWVISQWQNTFLQTRNKYAQWKKRQYAKKNKSG